MVVLVFCGPSGSGKSTLMKRMMADFEGKFGFSISHTSREEGREYHFSSREAMEAMKERGEFVEMAEFSGNLYGTSKKAVHAVIGEGKICLLDIDVQGVRALRSSEGSSSDCDHRLKVIFVRPPSLEVLEKRLRDRGTESEEAIQKRLSAVSRELEFCDGEGNVDFVLVNDDLEEAYKGLKGYVREFVEK